jgi:dihydroneopterin aldolase
MAILRLAGLKFTGHHGVSAEEKERGGRFEVDCEIETDIGKAAASDEIGSTIDYDLVYSIIREHLAARRYNLLEALAVKLKDELRQKTGAAKIRLRVRKIAPAVAGHTGYFEVETWD